MNVNKMWETTYIAYIDALSALVNETDTVLAACDPIAGNLETIDRARTLLHIAMVIGENIALPKFFEERKDDIT